MKVGDLVAGRASRKSFGIVFKIMRSHEADPYVVVDLGFCGLCKDFNGNVLMI